METSSNTINKYNEMFRDMICDKMLKEGNTKIGGPGLVVEYLPVYLWTVHAKKNGNSLPWDLFELISENIKVAPEDEEPEEESEEDNVSENSVKTKGEKEKREKIPCVYCGKMYGGIGGMKRHFNFCELNPHATKKCKK